MISSIVGGSLLISIVDEVLRSDSTKLGKLSNSSGLTMFSFFGLKCCLKCFKILSGGQEDVLLDVFNVVVCLLAVANNLSSSLVVASTFSFSASFLKCSFLSCLDLFLIFFCVIVVTFSDQHFS